MGNLGIIASSIKRPLAYRLEVLADSPIADWRLVETSGTNAADSAGSNPGTYTGTYTLGVAGPLTGEPSTAFDTGTNTGYVSIPDSGSTLDLGFGGGAFSVEVWFKRKTTGVEENWIFGKGSQNPFAYIDATNTLSLNQRGVGEVAHSTILITNTLWHHAVFIQPPASAGCLIYLDGTNVTAGGSGTGTWADTANAFRIGKGDIGDAALRLAEFAVYNSALSAARILAHYHAAGY